MGFWGFLEKTMGKSIENYIFLKSIKSSIIQFRIQVHHFHSQVECHRYSDVLRIPHFQTQPDRESQRDHILELVMSVQLFLNVLNTWGTAKSKVGQTFQKRLPLPESEGLKQN